MSRLTHTRRTVLRGLGAGTALLVGGVGAVTAEGKAGLRVAHASPNAPAVDVLVDGDVAVGGLAFGSVTDYLELDAGEYEVAVEPAGGGDPVFGPTTLELDDEDYTAVARGELGEDTDTAFTVDLLVDTNGANIGDDEARVRVYHAAPDAPTVDVTVDDGGLLFDGVERFTSSGYTVVDATTYDVEVRPDTEDDDGPVVFEASGVALTGRSTYTVFAIGYLSPDDDPNDEAFRLLPTLDAGAPPRGDEEEEEDDEKEDDGEEEDGGGEEEEDGGGEEEEDGGGEEEEEDGEEEDGGRGRRRGPGRGRERGR